MHGHMLNELSALRCTVGKQITIYNFFLPVLFLSLSIEKEVDMLIMVPLIIEVLRSNLSGVSIMAFISTQEPQDKMILLRPSARKI